jgi:hypothetical protein
MAQTDLITYSGYITTQGYEAVCDALKTKKSDSALLVLSTPGGDPHAGYRIARALQHCYGKFDALVPRYCKSAGTLALVGASRLYLDDMSELGPLDVQVKKGDEVIGRNSGLDIIQAVNYVQNQAMTAFRAYLKELTEDIGLSTKTASDISSGLTTGIFEPIVAQIDPTRLAEMQRAMEIAYAYGYRLAEKSGNMRDGGLVQLVTGFPSHGFVIDRKEARNIFIDVQKPAGVLSTISTALNAEMRKSTDSTVPDVRLFSVELQGESHEAVPVTAAVAAGSPGSESALGGNGQAAAANEPDAEAA